LNEFSEIERKQKFSIFLSLKLINFHFPPKNTNFSASRCLPRPAADDVRHSLHEKWLLNPTHTQLTMHEKLFILNEDDEDE